MFRRGVMKSCWHVYIDKDNSDMFKQVKGFVWIRNVPVRSFKYSTCFDTEKSLNYRESFFYFLFIILVIYYLFCRFVYFQFLSAMSRSPSVSVLLRFKPGIVLLSRADNDQIINISNVYLLLVAALCTHTLPSWTFLAAVSSQKTSVLFVLPAGDNESRSRARGCRRGDSPTRTKLTRH